MISYTTERRSGDHIPVHVHVRVHQNHQNHLTSCPLNPVSARILVDGRLLLGHAWRDTGAANLLLIVFDILTRPLRRDGVFVLEDPNAVILPVKAVNVL